MALRRRKRKNQPTMVVHSEKVGEEITESFVDTETPPPLTFRNVGWRARREVIPKSRELVTIGPESQWWTKTERHEGVKISAKGSILRLEPPATATDEDVERVCRLFSSAAAIRINPRGNADRAVYDLVDVSAAAKQSARAVILALVTEARTQDRERLREIVEATMDKVGL